MKKLVSMLLVVLMILPAAGFAEANEAAEIPTAAEAGGITFAFNTPGDFGVLAYKYPDTMMLEETTEGKPNDTLKYYADGYDPEAFGLVIASIEGYSAEEVADITTLSLGELTTEEYNGITWAVCTVQLDEVKRTVYACEAGGLTYYLLFASQHADVFDFTEFAQVFAQNATLK